jgi:glycosyltransferase involved in cell wall biosynthesis
MTLLNCLWIARELPFPLDSGDRIYTAHLSAALARAGVDVQMIAHASPDLAQPPADWPVGWIPVDGGKRSQPRALFSALPLAAAVHPTPAFRAELDRLLQSRRWDAIVIDQLGSGWALETCIRAARSEGRDIPIAYLSHNHEASLWTAMARDADGSPARRLALWQNCLKTRWLEHRLVRHVDLVTTITDEDARAFVREHPAVRTLTLPPGYAGAVGAARALRPDTPRRAIVVGSFRWVVKQENLRQFLAVADPLFARHGIGFDVIGDVPEGLRAALEPSLKATRLLGFVDDLGGYLEQARIAVVPELIGGGFKLKFLDYIFGGLPVATLAAAAKGLDASLTSNMMLCDDLEALARTIVDRIDAIEQLDGMQRRAFAAAHSLFRWEDRGIALRDAFERPARAAGDGEHAGARGGPVHATGQDAGHGAGGRLVRAAGDAAQPDAMEAAERP